MSDIFAGNPLQTFAAGQTDYIDRHNGNVSKITTGCSGLDDRVQTLESGSGLAQTADAAGNIPNLIVNGDFRLAYCGPGALTDTYLASIPYKNATLGTELVRWADCWFVKPDQADALQVETIDIGAGAGLPFHGEMQIKRGVAALSPYKGVIFQRLDYFYDLTNLRGKSVQFSVYYQANTDDEFHLEIDDGIGVSSNVGIIGGPSPAGTGISRVTHVIDASATKLTVRIVLDKDAVIAPNFLRLQYAHFRLGVGIVSLIGGTPPPHMPFEIFYAKMFSKTLRWKNHSFGCSRINVDPTLGGIVDYYDENTLFDIPLICLATANDLVDDTFLGPPVVPFSTDINLMAYTPSFSYSLLTRVCGPNYDSENKLLFSGFKMSLIRIVCPPIFDPDPAPDTGFYTGEIAHCVRIIPEP